MNGTVGIKFCSSKKYGTAVVVNRQSKQDFALVSAPSPPSLTPPNLTPQTQVPPPSLTTPTLVTIIENTPEGCSNKEKPINEVENPQKTPTKDPRVKELPTLVKQVVKKGSKEVESTGNGSCLIGTTALHITGDEEQTPDIARDLNTHIAQYRKHYLPKIEADFPLTITIGTNGLTKTFQKGEENEFFNWLAESKDAILMWRSCIDILAVSNMYQMDVDCIVYQEGSNPEVRYFSPDPGFPWDEDDLAKPDNKEVRKYPKMTILNYKDVHFNLVVENSSMIAQSGTFSYQRKMACKDTNNITKDQVSSQNILEKESSKEYRIVLEKKIETLEKTLSYSQMENKKIKEQIYSKNTNNERIEENFKCCECELSFQENQSLKSHMETEHFNFKFKCTVCQKGFNQKTNLFNHNKSHDEASKCAYKCVLCDINFIAQNALTDHNKKQHPKKVESELKYNYCNVQLEKGSLMETHMESHHKDDSQYICEECDYQTNEESRLKNHTNLTHKPSGRETEPQPNFKCVTCAQGFSIKSSLLKHRLNAHGKSKIKCRYKADNTCINGANNGEKCLYDHTDGKSQNNESLTCNVCGQNFKFKSQFLKHRKTEHPDTVPKCKAFSKGEQCSYGESCGFSHETTKSKEKFSSQTDHTPASSPDQIFQVSQKIMKPPDQMDNLMKMVQIMMVNINQDGKWSHFPPFFF